MTYEEELDVVFGAYRSWLRAHGEPPTRKQLRAHILRCYLPPPCFEPGKVYDSELVADLVVDRNYAFVRKLVGTKVKVKSKGKLLVESAPGAPRMPTVA